jgi:hypothetical protein
MSNYRRRSRQAVLRELRELQADLRRLAGTEDRSTVVKRAHARLRDDPQSPVIGVDDDGVWHKVHDSDPKPPLTCVDCDLELTPVSGPKVQRHFRVKQHTDQDCGHYVPPVGGGGPESDEHKWIKRQLAKIANSLRYNAVTEYPVARRTTDVMVDRPRFYFEVQDSYENEEGYSKRTRDLSLRSARVCWLIRDELKTRYGAHYALRNLPAVLYRVVDASTRMPLEPWHYPCDQDRARVEIFGTIGCPDPVTALFVPREAAGLPSIDAATFLGEVLSGRRRWFDPGKFCSGQGLWVLLADLPLPALMPPPPGPAPVVAIPGDTPEPKEHAPAADPPPVRRPWWCRLLRLLGWLDLPDA